MDLWHGKCRDAHAMEDPAAQAPAFRLSGPVATWKKVMSKQLDPMQAMMTMTTARINTCIESAFCPDFKLLLEFIINLSPLIAI
jgi:hypothetical protein